MSSIKRPLRSRLYSQTFPSRSFRAKLSNLLPYNPHDGTSVGRDVKRWGACLRRISQGGLSSVLRRWFVNAFEQHARLLVLDCFSEVMDYQQTILDPGTETKRLIEQSEAMKKIAYCRWEVQRE